MTLHEPDGYQCSPVSEQVTNSKLTAKHDSQAGGRLWTLADNREIPTGRFELARALMDDYG